MRGEDDWTEWDAGPVARPYVVTGGRTRQRTTLRFDLVDLVGRSLRPVREAALAPEHQEVLKLCEAPVAVADLASELSLPLGVLRVVLDDLVHDGLIEVMATAPSGRVTDLGLLERVLVGIKAL